MVRKLVIVGLAVAVLILITSGAVLAAEKNRPRLVQGHVTDVGDDSLIVETRDGEVEVLITEETQFRVPGVPQATLADIEVGVQVVIQPKAGDGETVTARIVAVKGPDRLQDFFVRGTVTAVAGDRVSVESAEGEKTTLLITDATRFWVPGEPPTTTVELNVDDPVLAMGKPQPGDPGEKVLEANLIVVASDEELPKILIRGRVVAVTRQTIVVQAGRGERAITVLPRTRFQSAGGRVHSARDVRQGEQIIALGQPTELGQWVAGLILLPEAKPPIRNGLRGVVVAKDAAAGTLTVETEQRGEITVVTAEQTRYRIPGVEEPGFDDIQVGAKVDVVGRFEEGSETVFLARGIGLVKPKTSSAQP